MDALGIAQRVGFAFLNGILSAGIAFIGVTLLARLFGIVTPFQLLELAHPRQPLLKRLAQDAPGTYYHSMIVGNLAEKAVEEIGGDPLLTRVAVFYHDIGKSLHPAYFIENQANMRNIHDTLDPYTSARVIIAHVTDGIAMAEEANLPRPIIDVIAQHHGTTRTEVFYQKAKEHDGDSRRRRTLPLSRARSHRRKKRRSSCSPMRPRQRPVPRIGPGGSMSRRAPPPNGDVEAARTAAIRTIVERIVQDRLKNGQLADAPLTLRDLDTIQRTFVAVLDGMYHPRIDYPEPVQPAPTTVESSAVDHRSRRGDARTRSGRRRARRMMEEQDNITVVIESAAADAAGLDPAWLARLLRFGLRAADAPASAVTLLITDDAGIQTLHRDFLNDDTPTDVLAFAAESEEDFPIEAGFGNYLGDIAVSWDTAAIQGPEADMPVEREVAFLALHGLLHLARCRRCDRRGARSDASPPARHPHAVPRCGCGRALSAAHPLSHASAAPSHAGGAAIRNWHLIHAAAAAGHQSQVLTFGTHPRIGAAWPVESFPVPPPRSGARRARDLAARRAAGPRLSPPISRDGGTRPRTHRERRSRSRAG